LPTEVEIPRRACNAHQKCPSQVSPSRGEGRCHRDTSITEIPPFLLLSCFFLHLSSFFILVLFASLFCFRLTSFVEPASFSVVLRFFFVLRSSVALVVLHFLFLRSSCFSLFLHAAFIVTVLRSSFFVVVCCSFVVVASSFVRWSFVLRSPVFVLHGSSLFVRRRCFIVRWSLFVRRHFFIVGSSAFLHRSFIGSLMDLRCSSLP
jgi:hypothetical protein